MAPSINKQPTEYCNIMHKQPDYNTGFTLIELMVTLAIASILLGIAVPSFVPSLTGNRLTSSANELVTAFNLARSEAVKRGASVTVRKVDDNSSTNKGAGANWEDGWDVFTDADNDGNFEAGDGDELIKTYAALPSSYTLRSNNFSNFIRFNSSGQSNGNGSFVICDNSDGNGVPEANTSKLIIVSSTGRVRMGLDVDHNGIPNTDTTASSNITSCTPTFTGP